MIKTIIKRDKREEDFSPAKVNAWGEWASKTLGSYVDWSTVVLETVGTCPEKMSSEALQERLIKTCLDYNTWSYNRMAGRLYAALIYKKLYEGKLPTVKELQTELVSRGYMVDLGYTDEEYAQVEKIINHKKDFKAAHFELDQVLKKYSIQNRVKKERFESQQFVFMRMAMTLASLSTPANKMIDLENWYQLLSDKQVNAPTPNFVNLGTPLRSYVSCCLYTVGDNAESLAVGDHIAYTMTYKSAGIGSHLATRSLGDPVRGGMISHQGKLPYYRSLVGAVKANMQQGRGGACTTHYNIFDPQIEDLLSLKNPMTTEDKRIRGMDYSCGVNKFFAKKVAKDEEIFLFNAYTAPDLYAALYGKDPNEFERLYEQYENRASFKKSRVSARYLAKEMLNQGFETGRMYIHWMDEMNRHTPFNEPIYSSNLCQEISLATQPYYSMMDLYSAEDHGRGEIALCTLAGMNVDNINDDKTYETAAYYALLMIDRCIHLAEYAFPHLEMTAKSRLNAGVGVIGLAHFMAKNKVKYSSQEGKQLMHELAERHYYFLLKASLKLGKELGNAPWMHKTKWADGWLPIDTHNRKVDTIVDSELKYDWETLREEVKANGGIRNTVLAAHMPSESSSKASGTTNGLYPARDLSLKKGDADNMIYWAAPEGEKLNRWYELAWDVPTMDMIDTYAIFQKFTDQGISGDEFRRILGDEKVGSKEMITNFLYMTKMGLKTRYYVNTKTTDGTSLDTEDEPGCDGGFCTL